MLYHAVVEGLAPSLTNPCSTTGWPSGCWHSSEARPLVGELQNFRNRALPFTNVLDFQLTDPCSSQNSWNPKPRLQRWVLVDVAVAVFWGAAV